MEDDKNIEMVAVDERNSSKEGSDTENGIVKQVQTDATSEKGILDVSLFYMPIDHSGKLDRYVLTSTLAIH
jgi:hypothetical protein